MTREFICEKCGYTIYSFGYDDGKNKCGLCKWLDEFVPDEEKQKVILHHVREGEIDATTDSGDIKESRVRNPKLHS